MDKPFSEGFSNTMRDTAAVVSMDFEPICAYVQSDEISYIFAPTEKQFNRRSDKFISLLASHTGSYFTHMTNVLGAFDGRIITIQDWGAVVDYLSVRQEDCYRNCVNAVAHYAIMNAMNISSSQAAKVLDKKSQNERIDIAINLDAWNQVDQKYISGSITRKITFEKVGYNPKDEILVAVERSKWIVDTAPDFNALGPDRVQIYLNNDLL